MLLNAVVCTWNEEDIIGSTVKHAFAQGCSNVFLVDNASTDDTVNVAVQAGAKLATIFKTDYFDEIQKIAHINTIVKYINEISSEKQIWWMYIDADEFPDINFELHIIDFLKVIDSSVRALHGYMFDHIPTHHPYHVPLYHPADFMPLAVRTSTSKIPILLQDKDKQFLLSGGGAHKIDTCGNYIPIVKGIIDIHHFPRRNPLYTLKRLKQILVKNDDGMSRIDLLDHQAKLINKSSDAQAHYHTRYRINKEIYKENQDMALKTKKLIYKYRNIVRWYNIYEEKIFTASPYENYINSAIFYYFMNEYDIALCKFKDVFDTCNDDYLKLWITVKMAECLSRTDIVAACNMIMQVYSYNEKSLCSYIDKNLRHILNYKQNKDIYKYVDSDSEVLSDIQFDVEYMNGEFSKNTRKDFRN
jgi:glycosyltransferase involved in cell wall biosynthesis